MKSPPRSKARALAGAGEVLVNDSHGPMRNLLFDELPADVRVLFGNRKPFSMVQDSDANVRRRVLRRISRRRGRRPTPCCAIRTRRRSSTRCA